MMAMIAYIYSITILLLLIRSSISIKATSITKPPINTIMKPGSGGEYGIRQLDQQETYKFIAKSRKLLGIPSGPNLDVFEMLEDLDIVAKIMPGKLPQRNEITVFGNMIDSEIECICAVSICKVVCPWTLDVISLITHPPYNNKEYTTEMFEFISELCLSNAILPSYSKLQRYEIFKNSNAIKPMKRDEEVKENQESDSYANCNGITLCIDTDIENLSLLGPFWYSTLLQEPSSYVYFRLRCSNREELEIQFDCPSTGINAKTGSSTVGGCLIINTDNNYNKNNVTVNLLQTLCPYIKRKIKHPQKVC